MVYTERSELPQLCQIHTVHRNRHSVWVSLPATRNKQCMESVVVFLSQKLPQFQVKRDTEVWHTSNEISCLVTRHIFNTVPPRLGATGVVSVALTAECYFLPNVENQVVLCFSNKSATKIDQPSLQSCLREIVGELNGTVLDPVTMINNVCN